jgi:hypothetical protein
MLLPRKFDSSEDESDNKVEFQTDKCHKENKIK